MGRVLLDPRSYSAQGPVGSVEKQLLKMFYISVDEFNLFLFLWEFGSPTCLK